MPVSEPVMGKAGRLSAPYSHQLAWGASSLAAQAQIMEESGAIGTSAPFLSTSGTLDKLINQAKCQFSYL